MAIFFALYQQVENHALQPIVYGRTVEISPLLVLVAVLIGAAVGGILGAIVAIPIFASLQIVAKDYAQRHLAKD
jgi:predicted PurR-regulated permease PerM